MQQMDSKQSPEGQNIRLPDLPPSDDADFWLEAEIHTNLEGINKVNVEEGRDKHYFVRTSGRQAQCKHCDWGFELDPGDKIENGHLYDKKGQLVI